MNTNSVKAIIVDDEAPSRITLRTYLNDFCPGVEIVAECESVNTAYPAILKYKPQLVFLDIEMPNGTGFDLLKKFKNPEFKVIFVTAFSEYAIRAIRFSAADYLLKPVKVDELIDSVNNVRDEIEKEQTNLNLQVLLESLSNNNSLNQRLVIPDIKGFTVVKVPEIIYCEADGYCTRFFLTGKRKLNSSKNLKHYEELLENHQIIKVHRSFLVNLEHVKGYTNQGEVQLSENLSCPLGNNYKQKFIEKMKG